MNECISKILALALLTVGGAACERTTEGLKQDTFAATAAADESADEAKRKLQGEVDDFKAETNVKLEQLNAALSKLEAKADKGLETSKEKLKLELSETRAKLGELKAESREDWQRLKGEVDQKLSELGRRMNGTLHEVGDEVEETVD
jgi:uncharacterized protein HemX